MTDIMQGPRVWLASYNGKRIVEAKATAIEAARAFFSTYPTARKVDLLEWEDMGGGQLQRTYCIGGYVDAAGQGCRTMRAISKAAALAVTV